MTSEGCKAHDNRLGKQDSSETKSAHEGGGSGGNNTKKYNKLGVAHRRCLQKLILADEVFLIQ